MKFFLMACSFSSAFLFSQQTECGLQKSEFIDFPTVDKESISCIAKNSEKKATVFYTLASWCVPCVKHLPDALQLEKDFNTDVYVVLVEAEDDERIKRAINIVKRASQDAKILVLKNSVYKGGVKKRNSAFVKQITPKQFETIPDFSKFIVLNNQGEVVMVTNWKDYKEIDRKNRENVQQMLSHTVIPLLK
ncbi:thiol-disulfide isomerase/thioredoxin [Chryseobacterium defluvii]|uniref:Thiol-disulfide isomerase/thioredoxin n=1 Tax=Chryseobacterium defluvii TaxID=160396 RepID=A0A840K9G5_9FLAO|nr:thioredoxin family protein [Chryseobacterium defluvii]MBB4805055.1 thiol-disulfide isomerase/thioredoxin [Chryseobacterium defluvii]